MSKKFDCSTIGYQIAEAVLSTKHIITRDSITLFANGSGNNARQELQQRIEDVLIKIQQKDQSQ